MDEESTRLLFAALERAGWKWESGSIMSPHGGIWFDWEGGFPSWCTSLAELRDWVSWRLRRIRTFVAGSEPGEDVSASERSISDTEEIWRAITSLLSPEISQSASSVDMLGISWESGNKIGLADVRRAEATLGITLPADFVAFALNNDGAVPLQSYFTCAQPRTGDREIQLGKLLSLDRSKSDGLLSVVGNSRGEPPAGLIPFGGQGAGDMICFDYRDESASPSVVYWLHDLSPDEAIVKLADSFTNFIALLHPHFPRASK